MTQAPQPPPDGPGPKPPPAPPRKQTDFVPRFMEHWEPGERLNRGKLGEPIAVVQAYRGKVNRADWCDAAPRAVYRHRMDVRFGGPASLDLGLLVGVGAWILSVAWLMAHYWSKI